MPTTSEVALVFADLVDAHTDLHEVALSPKQVRRTFSRFVELTQRLTSVMRKEFKSSVSQEWKASEFAGWNETTRLFKHLRNEEQHARQIYISVLETRFYNVFENDDRLLVFSGTWGLTDQLMESPPDGMTFFPVDPVTGQLSACERPAVRVEYQYLIQARDEDLGRRLDAIGTSNVHELSNQCLAVLATYHEFYASKIGTE